MSVPHGISWRRLWLLLVLLLLTVPLSANPLLEAMDRAQPTTEELERAREQLENPPAEPRGDLFVPPFHRSGQSREPPPTLCRSCHWEPPHRENHLKRAFLNMHSLFIACETCHWQPDSLFPGHGWTRLPGSSREKGFITHLLEGQPVVIQESELPALQIRQDWEESDLKARIRLKARLHHPLEAKGPACDACHRERDALLDFGALGYEDGRARELQLNPTARFVERSKPEKPGKEPRRIHIRDLLE